MYLLILLVIVALVILFLRAGVPLIFDWLETPVGLDFVVLGRLTIRHVPYSEILTAGRLRTAGDFAAGFTTITWANRLFSGTVFIETRTGQRFQFTPASADDFVRRIQAAAEAARIADAGDHR
jgi:hypothetical protein